MKKRIFILSVLSFLTGVTTTASVLPERICPDCLNLASAQGTQNEVSAQVTELGINVASILRPHLQESATGVAALPTWAPSLEGFTPTWIIGTGVTTSMQNLFSTLNPAFVMPACQNLWAGSLWPNELLPCGESSPAEALPPTLFSI